VGASKRACLSRIFASTNSGGKAADSETVGFPFFDLVIKGRRSSKPRPFSRSRARPVRRLVSVESAEAKQSSGRADLETPSGRWIVSCAKEEPSRRGATAVLYAKVSLRYQQPSEQQ
jgi:hypothetical protein